MNPEIHVTFFIIIQTDKTVVSKFFFKLSLKNSL